MGRGSHVLGLDLGTSSVKALVATVAGEPVSAHAVKTPIRSARGMGPLAREFSPSRLWEAVVSAIRGALQSGCCSADGIAGVGVTSQRQGIAVLDAAGSELYLGPNTDLRAVFEGAAQDERHREEFYHTTGHLPPFLMAPAKLRWLQAHRPALYGRAATVMTVGDWLVFRMTSQLTGERSLAGEAGLLDVATGRWAKQLMRRLGLREDWFPALVSSGAVVGPLAPNAADAIGLPRGVPVVAAGPDTQCGLLGLGVTAPGQTGALAGWSLTLQAVTSKPRFDPDMNAWVGLHIAPGAWVGEVNLGDAGASLEWVARLLYGRTRDAVRLMGRDAASVQASEGGAMAFFGLGPLDMKRLGMRTGGMLFPVPVTHTSVGPAALARAAVEAVAFSAREGLERLEKVSGGCHRTLAIGGGLVRSGPLAGILADVTGRDVCLSSVRHVSAYGAALAASVAIGFADMAEAADRAASRLTTVPTASEHIAIYEERYPRWREARKVLEQAALV